MGRKSSDLRIVAFEDPSVSVIFVPFIVICILCVALWIFFFSYVFCTYNETEYIFYLLCLGLVVFPEIEIW